MQSQMLTRTTRGADQQQQKSEREVAGSVAEEVKQVSPQHK